MKYIATTKFEGGAVLVSFPDCPGCQTAGKTVEDAREQAEDVLAGWLKCHLHEQEGVPPRPSFEGKGLGITLPTSLGLKLQLRWARTDAGLNQTELARRLGVSRHLIAQLEDPIPNPASRESNSSPRR